MNLPNKLTLVRILLVPLLVLVYIFPYETMGITVLHFSIGSTALSLVDSGCFLIFILASITDYFDGAIARKRNLITTFGKFVDPIADKLLVNTLLLLLAYDQRISIVFVIIMISRDTIVDAIRFFSSASNRVLPANIWGKAKTVCQMVAIILVLLNNIPFVFIGLPVDQIMVFIATVVSVVSGIIYFNGNKDLIMESM